MVTYRITRRGRHTFTRVLENGQLAEPITIPKELLPDAHARADKAGGKPFPFEFPATARRTMPRHYRTKRGVIE